MLDGVGVSYAILEALAELEWDGSVDIVMSLMC
jgi:hypothetical protein